MKKHPSPTDNNDSDDELEKQLQTTLHFLSQEQLAQRLREVHQQLTGSHPGVQADNHNNRSVPAELAPPSTLVPPQNSLTEPSPGIILGAGSFVKMGGGRLLPYPQRDNNGDNNHFSPEAPPKRF